MHVVADRPAIVSALPALTSTCMRRKTHSAWWRISCNTKVSSGESGGRGRKPTGGATGRESRAGERIETLIEAAEQVETLAPDGEGVGEVVGEKAYHSNQVMVEPTGLGARSARLMSTCYRAAGATAYSRLGAFCQVPELTSRRSDTASIRFSSESHPDLKSAHVTLTCVAPRAFSRSSVPTVGEPLHFLLELGIAPCQVTAVSVDEAAPVP